ncbi:hypothetical protein [Bradyrhizobium sp. USDA 4503]
MNANDSADTSHQQLSFDFPESQKRSIGLARADFARVKDAKALLRELARALGEQRAATDIESIRQSATACDLK